MSDLKSTRDALSATADDTRSKVAGHLGAAGNELKEGLREARSEIREGANEAKVDLARLGERAQVYADRAGHAVEQGWHDAVDRSRDLAARSGDVVRQNPLATIGIAVGVGFILAKLLSRR